MACRVVGGARAVNSEANFLKDQILGRCFLGWKVEWPLRGGPPLFFIMTI